MIVKLPSIHVPPIPDLPDMKDDSDIVEMISNLLSGRDALPNLNSPISHVLPAVLAAAAADVPNFGRPPHRLFYNYVIGKYKSEEHRRVHPGLVFRVGLYDPDTKRMVGRPTWQVETRMGVKHVQLFGPDLDILLSGVIMNDPVDGLFISPSSGTWAKKKETILRKMRSVTERTDTLLDLMNLLVTRRVIQELATRGGLRRPLKDLRFEAANGTIYVSVVIPGKLPVHRFHTKEECISSYRRKLASGSNSNINARCKSNIPSLFKGS